MADAVGGERVKEEGGSSSIYELDLNDIRPNSYQPRTEFDSIALQELADSIRSVGLITPITVWKVTDTQYEIIAGERRFRASKLAGLKTIPAYIRTKAEDASLLEMALVENIQREDLNAIEVAIGYQRLLEEFQLTQDKLSERVGKNRSSISNYLRLLKLPAQIQLAVRDKKISMGHARAIIGVEDAETQVRIFEQILQDELSVRQVEEIVKDLSNPVPETPPVKNSFDKKSKKESPINYIGDYVELQSQLSKRFSTKVELKRSTDGKGKIVIPFRSDTELESIVGLLDLIE